jgi:hypothetical protein
MQKSKIIQLFYPRLNAEVVNPFVIHKFPYNQDNSFAIVFRQICSDFSGVSLST